MCLPFFFGGEGGRVENKVDETLLLSIRSQSFKLRGSSVRCNFQHGPVAAVRLQGSGSLKSQPEAASCPAYCCRAVCPEDPEAFGASSGGLQLQPRGEPGSYFTAGIARFPSPRARPDLG